jgi:hypothetical protein
MGNGSYQGDQSESSCPSPRALRATAHFHYLRSNRYRLGGDCDHLSRVFSLMAMHTLLATAAVLSYFYFLPMRSMTNPRERTM